MDYSTLISQRRDRFEEVEQLITDPELFSDPKRGKAVMSEHSRLKDLLAMWGELVAWQNNS
jgi:peptide chain release factor 1